MGKTRLLLEAERAFGGNARTARAVPGSGRLGTARTRRCLGALRPMVRDGDPALDETQRRRAREPREAAAEPRHTGRQRWQRRQRTGPPVREPARVALHLLSSHQPLIVRARRCALADSSTRAFVSFLARSSTSERRAAAAELPQRRAAPSPSAAPAAGRARTARQLPADRTRALRSRRAGTRHWRTSSAESPEADLIDRLLTRTDGNPLYVEELLAAALDGRGAMPQSSARRFHAADRRLERRRRPGGARRRVVGRSLDQATIERCLRASGGAALERGPCAKPSPNTSWSPTRNDRFCFRHALLREVVIRRPAAR